MIVTDPGRAPDLPGAEIAVARYEDAEALARALEPGDRVFMVSLFMAPEERLARHRSFVDAASRQRVGHVVYLSFIGAGPAATFSHARSHGKTEQMLRESGLSWCGVRNAMYGDQMPDWFDPLGRITGPGGNGRVSFSMIEEIAESIAVLLTDETEDGRELVTVTTPESVSLAELAALASDVTGGRYVYEPTERDTWIAYRRTLGRPEWSVEAGLSYYDGVGRGEADVIGHDYQRLTGKEPTTIRSILERQLGATRTSPC
jgi:uncharacterized protein YbjT (DUF2867 family)